MGQKAQPSWSSSSSSPIKNKKLSFIWIYYSPWTRVLCLDKWSFLVNVLLHWSHICDSAPLLEWTRVTWSLSLSFLENLISQSWHWNFLIPLCVNAWRLKLPFSLKTFSQSSHFKFRFRLGPLFLFLTFSASSVTQSSLLSPISCLIFFLGDSFSISPFSNSPAFYTCFSVLLE